MTNTKHIIMDNEEGKVEEVVIEKVDNFETDNEESKVEEGESKKFEESPEAKRARLKRQLEQLEKKHPELTENKSQKPSKKSDDLDYGQKAFLFANGIKGGEVDLVKGIMKETGKSIEQVLESKYFQAELKEMREIQQTRDAVPNGTRSGATSVDSVEFWLTKDFKDVPQEMRGKVIEARLKGNKGKGVFYNR